MKTHINLTVYKATFAECFTIFSEPRLLKALPISGLRELSNFLATTDKEYYIIKSGDKKLIFCSAHLGDGIYDFHVACPRDSIRASRPLIFLAIKWVLNRFKKNLVALTTACPEGKMANVCRKVGAKELITQAGEVHFIMLPTALDSLNSLN